MVDQAPSTPENLRADARNTLRLAEFARDGREKGMLPNAANEFLNMAAELEARTEPATAGQLLGHLS
jgi:hypothetical protein